MPEPPPVELLQPEQDKLPKNDQPEQARETWTTQFIQSVLSDSIAERQRQVARGSVANTDQATNGANQIYREVLSSNDDIVFAINDRIKRRENGRIVEITYPDSTNRQFWFDESSKHLVRFRDRDGRMWTRTGQFRWQEVSADPDETASSSAECGIKRAEFFLDKNGNFIRQNCTAEIPRLSNLWEARPEVPSTGRVLIEGPDGMPREMTVEAPDVTDLDGTRITRKYWRVSIVNASDETGARLSSETCKRISQIEYKAGEKTQFGYDMFGKLSSISWRDGSRMEMTATGWKLNGMPWAASDLNLSQEDGTLSYKDEKGVIRKLRPTGTEELIWPDGSRTTIEFADDKFIPLNGLLHAASNLPDYVTQQKLKHPCQISYPDGSVRKLGWLETETGTSLNAVENPGGKVWTLDRSSGNWTENGRQLDIRDVRVLASGTLQYTDSDGVRHSLNPDGKHEQVSSTGSRKLLDANGRVVERSDARHHCFRFQRDSDGNIIAIATPDGATISTRSGPHRIEIADIFQQWNETRPKSPVTHPGSDDSSNHLQRRSDQHASAEAVQLAQMALSHYSDERIRAIAIRLALLNALPEDERSKLTGSGDILNPRQVAGQLANGTLAESGNKFLLEDIQTKLEHQQSNCRKDVRGAAADLEQLSKQKLEQWQGLAEMMKEGSSDWRHIFDDGWIPYEVQVHNCLVYMGWKQGEISQAAERAQKLSLASIRADVAQETYEYTRLKLSGQTIDAYLNAADMWTKYGESMKVLAPSVWDDLEKTGWAHLRQVGLTRLDQIPEYNDKDGHARFVSGLKGLSNDIDAKASPLTDAIRAQALRAIDSHPDIQNLLTAATQFNHGLTELETMFALGVNGTKTDRFVDRARLGIEELRNQMAQVSISDINLVISKLAGALQDKDNPIRDEQARTEIQKRVAELRNAVALFDPASDTHKRIEKLFQAVNNNAFDADTILNWLKNDGPVFLATTAAMAGTFAATGGWGILLAPLVAQGASAATQELLYGTSFGPGTRSPFGAYLNGDKIEFEESATGLVKERQREFWQDVAKPQLLEYVHNVAFIGLTELTLGVGTLLKNAALNAVSQAGKAGCPSFARAARYLQENTDRLRQLERMAAAHPESRIALGKILDGMKVDILFQGAQLGTEKVILSAGASLLGVDRNQRNAAGAELDFAHAFTSFAVTVGLIMVHRGINFAQGCRRLDHTNHFEVRVSKEDFARGMDELRIQGYLVEELAGNRFTVKTPDGGEINIKLAPSESITADRAPATENGAHNENRPVDSAPALATDSGASDSPNAKHDPPVYARQDEADPYGQSDVDRSIHLLNRLHPGGSSRGDRLIIETIMTEGRRMGLFRKLGIPEELVRIRLVRNDNNGAYSTFDNAIEINPTADSPMQILRHELDHMKRCIERTALAEADPGAYRARVLESVLDNVGNGSKRFTRDENFGYSELNTRALLSPEGKGMMRQAIAEVLNSGCLPAKVLNQAKYKALLQEVAFRGRPSLAATELRFELDHYQKVLDGWLVSRSEILHNQALRELIDSKVSAYQHFKQTHGNSLFTHPNLIRITKQLSESTTASADTTDNRAYRNESREEMSARRAEWSQGLRQIAEQIYEQNLDSTSRKLRTLIREAGKDLIEQIRLENAKEKLLGQRRKHQEGDLLWQISESLRALAVKDSAAAKTNVSLSQRTFNTPELSHQNPPAAARGRDSRDVESDRAKAPESDHNISGRKTFSRMLEALGWPKKVAGQYARTLSADDLVRSIRELNSQEPRTMFLGSQKPFDAERMGSLDELTNAATALEIHSFGQGYVLVFDRISAAALEARFGSGDTSFYEQSWGVDRSKLTEPLAVYSVPRDEFAKILRETCANNIVRVEDPEAQLEFPLIKPGHETEVGRKIIQTLKEKGINPVEFDGSQGRR